MIRIEIDNNQFEANEGDTIFQAAAANGITIPTLCYMDNLPASGACRLCVVEVEGWPGLIPSCSYPAQNGMKVKTHSPKVLEARKTIVELLLGNHPDDCLYCERSGKCELQSLAINLGVRGRRFTQTAGTKEKDISSPSIVRDPNKCVLCGKCVRVCEEIQAVGAIDFLGRGSGASIGTAFDRGMNISSCINCGQCILACPTGALAEQSHVKPVLDAIADPHKFVVVQHAPAVSVSLAEEFGQKPGADVDGQMVAALRRAGFQRVFDTSFTADLTIMEEASELAHRVANGGVLPMMTSCSPGWIKFVEQFYPEFLPNISTCKSPQQMMGAIIKSFFAEKENLDPKNIVSVSIMPCTAKKFECNREEMGRDHTSDVDFVLTTRELAALLKMQGIDVANLEPDTPDTPFGERSSAGKIFGASGGVMEAAVRTAHKLLTGKELESLDIQDLRGTDGTKELTAKIGDLEVNAVVVSGLSHARKILDAVKAGHNQVHFIEVMTCPGGCIAGGGQPIGTDVEAIKKRMGALYDIDSQDKLRCSHDNKWVQRLYDEYLKEPLSEKSHHLLHTHYSKRDVLL